MNHSYFIFYERIHHPGSGFRFPCTKEGEVLYQFLTSAQQKKLYECRENKWHEFRNPRVVRSNEVDHVT